MPTSSDDVFFDGASGAVTVTTSGTTTDVCNNLDCTGFTGTLSHANNTTIQVYGNMTTVSGMTYTIGGTGAQLSFLATATGKTLTTGGKVWPKLLFDGVGGDWQLQDALLLTNGQAITLTNGTIKFNAKNVGGASNGVFLSSSNSNTRGLDFTGGTTTWTTGNSNTTFWDIGTSTNMTLTNASNLTITQGNSSNNGTFAGGGLTYGTLSNTALTSGSLTTTGANMFAALTLGGGGSGAHILAANQTVSGTFTSNGTSVTARSFIKSSVRGTARTITAATVTCANVDLQDITGAGAGSWNLSAITGGSGNCGGCSGITFTTGGNQYWVPSAGTSSGSMNVVTRWASSSGGTAGTGRVPLPQDTAIFDANSIDAGSRTITQNIDRLGAVNWTGVTNTPLWNKTSATRFYGSITMVNGMTQGGGSIYTYEGRGTSTLTGGSTTWTNPITVDCVDGTGTLAFGDSITSNQTLTLTSGTASATSVTIQFTSIGTSSLTADLNLVSATLNLSTTGVSINGSGTGGGLAANPIRGFVS